MSLSRPDADRIADLYLGSHARLAALGSGIDGIVYSTIHATAIKVHSRQDGFERELAVYQRLKEYGVQEICGFAVPRLIKADGKLRVIEMSIVRPPYILDFAKSTLHRPEDFGPEVMAE